jgi:hypothetical protein
MNSAFSLPALQQVCKPLQAAELSVAHKLRLAGIAWSCVQPLRLAAGNCGRQGMGQYAT